MDPDIVNAKLESLSRCIRRIAERRPASPSELSGDLDAQDIIVLNLERAVQLSVDIGSHILLDHDAPSPESMAGVFSALSAVSVIDEELGRRLGKAAGFRNLAVHEYESIDWSIVFSIVTERLDDFRLYAASILDYIKRARFP